MSVAIGSSLLIEKVEPRARRRTHASYLAVVGFALLTLAMVAVHGGAAVNFAFPLLATSLGGALFVYRRSTYVAYTGWVWLFTPEVCRLVDYKTDSHTIGRVMLTPMLVTAFAAFKRIGDFFGRWLPGQDRVKHTQLCYRTDHKYRLVEMHEGINVKPVEIQSGNGIILHFGFSSVSDHMVRFNQISELEAERVCANRQKFYFVNFIFRPPIGLAYQMLMRRPWQGAVGIFVALLWVYYDLTIQLKLYEPQTMKPSIRPTLGTAL